MQRRYLWWSIVLLFLLASSILAIIPGTYVLAHGAHATLYVGTPTPTPDASSTLQMAQQEENNIQTILSIINVLVVVFPILIAVAGVLLGYFGFRGFRETEKEGKALLENIKNAQQKALEDIKNLQEEAREDTKKLQKEAAEQLEDIKELQKEAREDIKNLQEEAAEKKKTIERTQEALVYLALGDRLSNQNDTRKAIEAYKKAGSLLPGDPQINYVLGRIYSGFGYYEDAIKSFEASLVAQPEYPEAEMELGLAYRRRGEYQKGSDAEAMRKQDYEKAIEHLHRAIALRPHYDDALSTLGGLYRRNEEYEKALEFYEGAYRADPTSAYAAGNVASLAWRLGKLDKARQYYMLTEMASMDRTMTTHAEVYWDYYDLALAQLALGKTEEAKKNYQKAIGETPGVVQFDSVLSVLYFLQKAKDRMPGLDEVIETLEKEKMTRVSRG
jgi:tetratricopeptide (TPR) repeat protein